MKFEIKRGVPKPDAPKAIDTAELLKRIEALELEVKELKKARD
jgi:hypothetical protein